MVGAKISRGQKKRDFRKAIKKRMQPRANLVLECFRTIVAAILEWKLGRLGQTGTLRRTQLHNLPALAASRRIAQGCHSTRANTSAQIVNQHFFLLLIPHWGKMSRGKWLILKPTICRGTREAWQNTTALRAKIKSVPATVRAQRPSVSRRR